MKTPTRIWTLASVAFAAGFALSAVADVKRPMALLIMVDGMRWTA